MAQQPVDLSKSLLNPPTWGNLADGAFAEMNATIEGFWKSASWDVIPTWDDLMNTPEMWELRVRSQMAAVGCSDEVIKAEARRLMALAARG